MQNITFISTIHKEIGECNSEELYNIIKKISPEVIFLEALNDTYSEYENFLFSNYEVYHQKLEIAAIQIYQQQTSFEYVPVCEIGLSDAFHSKINITCQNRELQKLIESFNFLASKYGFKFLNSQECINLQDEMRVLESRILNNRDMDEIVKADIEAYENPMIKNICTYCEKNHFSSAIFMFGAAHRKSIIEKIKTENKMSLSWTVFEG
jgi:hypothetical protein